MNKTRFPWLAVILTAVAATLACNLLWFAWVKHYDEEWKSQVENITVQLAEEKKAQVDGHELGKIVRLWHLEHEFEQSAFAAKPGSRLQTMRTFKYIQVRPAFAAIWRGLTPREQEVAAEVCRDVSGRPSKVSDLHWYSMEPRSLDFIDGMTPSEDKEAQRISDNFQKVLQDEGLLPRPLKF